MNRIQVMVYSLHAKQRLPINLETAWEFLTDPRNLGKITPPEMGFKIISGADRSLYPGQLIEYKVRPLPGFTTRWISEITQVRHMDYFVDEQREGPYAMWHHTHFLKEVDGGVEIEDLISYKVPFGLIGRLLHPVLVRPKLEKIFAYRQTEMTNRFGKL